MGRVFIGEVLRIDGSSERRPEVETVLLLGRRTDTIVSTTSSSIGGPEAYGIVEGLQFEAAVSEALGPADGAIY
jgi:hypothetical protein